MRLSAPRRLFEPVQGALIGLTKRTKASEVCDVAWLPTTRSAGCPQFFGNENRRCVVTDDLNGIT